jgi:dipeptidyl aminopeptidase/acylaminoacyl peptidase
VNTTPQTARRYRLQKRNHGPGVSIEARSGQFAPVLSGISVEDVAFSNDGQWVAYVSYPEGVLWRSKLDGGDKVKLSSPPLFAALPRWSPDGKYIAFHNYSAGKPGRIYLVSADAGSARQLLPEDSEPKQDPDWSPDGDKIIFGSVPADRDSALRVLDLKTHQVSTRTRLKRPVLPPLVTGWQVHRGHACGFAELIALRLPYSEVDGTRESKSCFPELVKRWAVCLLLAVGGQSGGAASSDQRPQGGAGF